MNKKHLLSISLAGIALAGIVGIGASVPTRHQVIVIQACESQDYIQTGPQSWIGTNTFRIQAIDGSTGAAFVPTSWWYTNGTSGQTGNLPFAQVLAMYLDRGYKIIASGVSSPQGVDPITVVLCRE